MSSATGTATGPVAPALPDTLPAPRVRREAVATTAPPETPTASAPVRRTTTATAPVRPKPATAAPVRQEPPATAPVRSARPRTAVVPRGFATGTGPPVELYRHPVAGGPVTGRMLLLHGLGNSATVWDAFLAHRPAGQELWTADLPWRGAGDGGWHRAPDATRWLAEALDGVPGGAGTVVAHSFSALQTLALLDRELDAGRDPFERYGIEGLVLVSPFYRRTAEEFDWDSMTRYPAEFERIMEEGIRVHSGGRLDPEIQLSMARRVCDRIGPYGWLRFVDSYLRTPWLRPGRIRVPVAVVCGALDIAVDPAEGRDLTADLPDAYIRVLTDCGHFLMTERPAEFSSVVGDFVMSLSSRARSQRPGDRAPGEPAP
ncbi:alpha/beta hydrolase [Streptomyces sp. ATCC51928]|uniref:Alpha/beta hydrolase n=1 Tax=Streptomyces caviscabies TaxID=90079 RepID=A0ABW2MP48_9ACTN|nr:MULTISPECIES: alpha/beta hydrolase [unclassified Streptomyces]MDX3500805.1 alpha/beta hydrolase [Streptomyces sp. ATCC51928]MDX5520866.1 alpha/beta hydrolase [Streptomyces sp. DE06-01C]